MPRVISDILPPVWRSADAALSALINKIESGVLIGEQVGPGCWIAVATREEIICFINELYSVEWGNCQSLSGRGFAKRVDKVVVLLRRLDPEKNYALVGRRL